MALSRARPQHKPTPDIKTDSDNAEITRTTTSTTTATTAAAAASSAAATTATANEEIPMDGETHQPIVSDSHLYEGGDSDYEEDDSFGDDEEDDEWKPTGCRQSRVMKRPSKGRKKYETQRQTRSQSRAALSPRDTDYKYYSSLRQESHDEEEEEEETNYGDDEMEPVPLLPPIKLSLKGCNSGNTTTSVSSITSHGHRHESSKVAAFRTRACQDCGLKHSPGDCPLLTPTLIVTDTRYDPESTIVQAEATLPKGLKLDTVDKIHGHSVFTTEKILRYTQFGPLIGRVVAEAEISEDANLKNIWEAFGETKTYLDTSDPATSNWLRYLRPARTRDDRNTVAVTRTDGRLYFVTTQDIGIATELLYWSEDPSVTWSKKKLEKTSCGGCNQRFEHPLYYRMHCMIFHDPNFSLTIRKYHCKVCGVAVLGKENIMKHAMEMHDGKGAYQCQYCKKFFLRLNYLEMHRTYGCRLNPQRSRPLCDLCGKKFCQPQKLKVHIRRMHSDTHVSYSCKLNPWKMHPLCETCGKKFCQPQHLRAHIKRMHSDMSEVLKEFQCKTCFKLLGSRAALQRHLKEVHNKDQNIAATCDRCGKTFQNKSNLKIHMLTHSGVKPFRCCEAGCTAAFTTKQCLQFHYKKVHGYGMHNMPGIERCVAYTFESYSGGLLSVYERSEIKLKIRKDRGASSETSHDTIGVGGGSEDSNEITKSFNLTPEKLVEVALKTMDPSASPLPESVNCIKQEGTPMAVLDSTSENSTVDSHLHDAPTSVASTGEMQGASAIDSPHQESLMDGSLDACKEIDMSAIKCSAVETFSRHVLQRQLALGLSNAARSMLDVRDCKVTNSRGRLDPLQQLEHDLELGRHAPDLANQYSTSLALCLARQRAEMINAVGLAEADLKPGGRHSENGSGCLSDMGLVHMNDGMSLHSKSLHNDGLQCENDHEMDLHRSVEMNRGTDHGLETNLDLHPTEQGMMGHQSDSGMSHHHHHGLTSQMVNNASQLDHASMRHGDQLELRRHMEHELSLAQHHADVNDLDLVSSRTLHLDLSQDRPLSGLRSRSDLSSRASSLEMDASDHRMDMSPHTPQLASHREHLIDVGNEMVHPMSRHQLRSPLSLQDHHGYNLSQHRSNLSSPLSRCTQEQSLDMSCHTSNMNSPTPSRCSDLNSPLPNQDPAMEMSRQCDTPAELSRPPSHSIDLTTGRPTPIPIDLNRPPSHAPRQMTPGVEMARPSDILSLEASRMVCTSGYQAYSPPMYQSAPPAHMPPPSPTVHSSYHSYPGYY